MENREMLVVGLGNPGEQYSRTRHNIGFMLAEEIADRYAAGLSFKEKWQAASLMTGISGARVHLVKPLTFMNRSGTAVLRFMSYYKIAPSHLLVIHDDLDMPCARIKLVKGGGAGGHNGIRSIVSSLGTKDFFRLKVGIGRPGMADVHKDFPVDKYVLSHFTAEDVAQLSSRLDPVLDGLELFFGGDVSRAQTLLNSLR